MSMLQQNYGNSSFMILVEVVTLTKSGVVLPGEALPQMEQMATKLCKGQGCAFSSLKHNGNIITFNIYANLHMSDLGKLIGVIKSHWARMLKKDFKLESGVWLPKYLVLSETPTDRERLRAEWIKKVTESSSTGQQ